MKILFVLFVLLWDNNNGALATQGKLINMTSVFNGRVAIDFNFGWLTGNVSVFIL